MTRVTRFMSVMLCLFATPALAADISSTTAVEPLPESVALTSTATEPELPVAAEPAASAQPARAAEVPTMGEVVVTAARMPQSRSEVPDTVSVVGKSDLAPAHALDLGDAVARTAGIEVARYGGPGSLSSVSVRGSRGSQVLVLQDGRPLNSVSSGEANTSLVPAGAIDRVEVLRGPSGLLYGSSPLGGVVNVITAEPPDRFRGEITGEDGTYGTRLTRVEAGGPLGPVRLLLRDERTRTDGYRPNGDARSEDTFVKAATATNPRIDVQAGAFDDSLGTPGPKPAGDPLLRTTTQGWFGDALSSSLVDRQADHRRHVMTGVTYEAAGMGEVSLRHYAEENRLESSFGSYAGPMWGTNPSVGSSRTITRVMGLEGQAVTGPWAAEHARLTAGGSWRRERMADKEESYDVITGITADQPGLRAATETGAGYAELSARPLARLAGTPGVDPAAVEGLTLAGGARYDSHSLFGGVTNGHAGAAWEYEGTTARASAGTTFRAPTLSDLLTPSTPYYGGNPALRPERGRTFEWSIERQAGHLTGRVGAYARKVRDQIDWAPDATGKWTPGNVGQVRVRGEEAEGTFRAGRVRLSASLTTIRAIQRKTEVTAIDADWMSPTFGAPVATVVRERPAAHMPAYTAGATLTVRLPWDTELGGALRHAGTRLMYLEQDDWFTGNVAWATKRLAPFTTATVRASKRIGRRAEIWLGIDNVADAKYATRFGNDATDDNYPAPPRTWFAGARMSW
ncbi:MAG: TonB-dependent receptor [Candidatus Coatesbacteria bacterium]